MRYAVARCHQKQRDDAYRLYVAECLRILTENTSKTVAILGRGRVESVYMVGTFGEKPKKTVGLQPGEATRRVREKLRSEAID